MDPLETGKLIILLGGIAGLYLKMNSAVRAMTGRGESREITNTPLHVQEQSRPATLEDLGHLEDRVDKLEREVMENQETTHRSQEKILDEVAELRDRVDDRYDLVADKLSEIQRAVGRLEGSQH